MKKIILSFIILLMTTIAASADIYVVSAEKADVREADSEKAEVIGSLRKGMEINVAKIDGGFCQIDFMGVKGFVSINDLKFKSRSEKSSDGDDNVVDKTKGFVSNTSRKVAGGVSGLSGKLFGKKKQKTHDEPEVVEEAEVSAQEENAPVQPASENAVSGSIARSEEQASGITAGEYTRRVAEAEANAANVTEEGAAGVIYLFDNHQYVPNMVIRFNGNIIPLPELELIREANKWSMNLYRRAVTKVVVKNPGRIILSRDFTWYEKPFHDELTLDVADGDVYYVEYVHGLHNKLNLMKTKDGEKEYKKVSKDTKNWKVNPPQYYEE